MNKVRFWASVTLTLGILGLVFFVLMLFALIDISHGEQNVTAEWALVRLGLLVMLFLIVATFVCTGLVLKYFRDRSGPDGPKPLP